MNYNMKGNAEVVRGISTQLSIEELTQHRKAVAAYILALHQIIQNLPENDYEPTMLTAVKVIESLSQAADYYMVYTKAMQIK